jgi:hypothetical protein
MPRTAGAVRKTYVPVTLDQLASSKIATPAEAPQLAPASRGAKAAERSPVQKQFDEWVEELYVFWVNHGKPEPFTNDYPPRKVFVNPDQADTIHLIARGSANNKNHGLHFGTDTPTTDGLMCVSFCVTDKQERKAKSDSNGSSAN